MTTQTAQYEKKDITSVEECKQLLVQSFAQLRKDNNISESEAVSLYVTDVPLIHSTIAEYEEDLKQIGNLTDVVQVNVKAGNPMPEALPHIDYLIGKDEVTVAIERSED